jgi:Uma2 family endonuclease
MSAHATRRMTIDEFLAWQMGQELRFELVDGQPRAMTGARLRHDRVVANLLRLIGVQFRAAGNPCDAFTADIAIIVPAGNVRRPDVSVLCPPFDDLANSSRNPCLVAEVLSDSTENVDRIVKLEEYKAIPGLDYILLAAPDLAEIVFWSRDAGARWQHQACHDLGATLDLPRLGVRLPLTGIYDRVTLRQPTGPRLVWPEEPIR